MRELLKKCVSYIARNDNGMEARKLIEDIKCVLENNYVAAYVDREDIERIGFDASGLMTDDMLRIANRMCESYQDNGGFNEDLRYACEFWNVPEKKEEQRDEEADIRRCTHCGKPMKQGYKWGGEYYCCDECLHAVYSQEEIDSEMYMLQAGETLSDLTEEEKERRFNEQDECYYTEWDSIYFSES